MSVGVNVTPCKAVPAVGVVPEGLVDGRDDISVVLLVLPGVLWIAQHRGHLARIFYGSLLHQTGAFPDEGKTFIKRESVGEGECGDFAALFIALSRAKGIPARPVVGYWAISGINQTHVWAEFYLEGLGWIPVDPTFGQTRPGIPGKPDYYFGSMDNRRVILNKGFNIPLDPPGSDNYLAPFLQVPLWWFWGSGGDANTVSMKRTMWKVAPIG